MQDFIIYSLKTGACIAVFYLFYKLLLSRETFHRVNRVVLLVIMLLAFLLPVCVITVYRHMPAPSVPVADEMVSVYPDERYIYITGEALQAPGIEEQQKEDPWGTVISILFISGLITVFGASMAAVLRINSIIRSGEKEKLDRKIVLVKKKEQLTPFSWLKYIVISSTDLKEHGEHIISHEKAHIDLRHSYDIILADIACCLQWFNPAMWLLRRELVAIHEYEADRAVLESGADPREYQLLLIKKAVGAGRYSIANSLNHSKLKNRITMMLQKKSKPGAKAKIALLLPMVCFALTAFARTEYIPVEDKVNEKIETGVLMPGQKSIDADIATADAEFPGDTIYISNGKLKVKESDRVIHLDNYKLVTDGKTKKDQEKASEVIIISSDHPYFKASGSPGATTMPASETKRLRISEDYKNASEGMVIVNESPLKLEEKDGKLIIRSASGEDDPASVKIYLNAEVMDLSAEKIEILRDSTLRIRNLDRSQSENARKELDEKSMAFFRGEKIEPDKNYAYASTNKAADEQREIFFRGGEIRENREKVRVDVADINFHADTMNKDIAAPDQETRFSRFSQSGNSNNSTSAVKRLRVDVDKRSRIIIEGKIVPLNEVENTIKKIAEEEGTRNLSFYIVTIVADKDVRMGRVEDVLKAVSKAGVGQVKIRANPAEQQSGPAGMETSSYMNPVRNDRSVVNLFLDGKDNIMVSREVVEMRKLKAALEKEVKKLNKPIEEVMFLIGSDETATQENQDHVKEVLREMGADKVILRPPTRMLLSKYSPPVYVFIDQHGRIRVNTKYVEATDLKETLEREAKVNETTGQRANFLVRSDKDAPRESFENVIDILAKINAGIDG